MSISWKAVFRYFIRKNSEVMLPTWYNFISTYVSRGGLAHKVRKYFPLGLFYVWGCISQRTYKTLVIFLLDSIPYATQSFPEYNYV